jgi:hypothetical protein
MLRKAARELVDTLTVWDQTFVQNTIENRLSATTVVQVFVDRKEPVVGCLAGIRNYLKFDFDVAKPNTVTAYVANGMAPEQLTFKILTNEERVLEQESAAEEERLLALLDRE